MTLPLGTDRDSGPPKQRDERERRHVRNVLLGIAAAVLAAALVATSYLVYLGYVFNSNTTTIEQAFPEEGTRPDATEPSGAKEPLNIVLMGTDSREARALDDLDGAAANQRADTLMLLHVPADRGSVYTMSIMRDLWVEIPGHGESKINAALNYGGVPLVVQTVESLFGQRIDHVAIMDFQGFKGLTNAVGGVEVHSPYAFTSFGEDSYTYTAGPNFLQGEEALAFVRERYAFPDGDYQRVRNQQTFLKALIDEMTSAETLSNPVTVSNIVQSVSPFISVDESLTAGRLAGLGWELRNVRERDMYMFTLPTNGTGTSSDGQSIVLPNYEAITKIADALAADTLGDYVAANNFEKGN